MVAVEVNAEDVQEVVEEDVQGAEVEVDREEVVIEEVVKEEVAVVKEAVGLVEDLEEEDNNQLMKSTMTVMMKILAIMMMRTITIINLTGFYDF